MKTKEKGNEKKVASFSSLSTFYSLLLQRVEQVSHAEPLRQIPATANGVFWSEAVNFDK